jgi:DNA-binding transcriptional LysR family regulator
MSAAYLVFPSRRDMTARVRAFAETLKQHAVAAA